MDAIPFILFILVWVLLYKYLINKKQKGKIVSHILGFISATVVMLLSIIPLLPEATTEELEQNRIEQLEYEKKNTLAVTQRTNERSEKTLSDLKKSKVNENENKLTYDYLEVTKSDFKEKWPFKNDIAILKCYQDEVAKMPVVIVGGKSYGLTGYADSRYGQDDLKALNKIWLENPKIKGLMIDLDSITKATLKLCK